MDNYEISVIVPVYNGEKYLRECIESILSQSFRNFELILVNDGSTDNSENICNEYVTNDNRVKVISKPNGGASSARNLGIDNSVGNYIIFCDSDDWIEKEFIEILYRNIKENNCDIVYSGVYRDFYYDDKKIQNEVAGISEEKYIKIENLQENLEYIMRTMSGPFLSPWGKLYKADIIRNNKLYFDTSMICYEDHDFNLKFLMKCKSLYFSKEIKYHFRGMLGNGGIKKRKKNDLVYEISMYHHQINKLLNKLKYNEELKEYIENTFIEHYKLVFQKILLEEKNMNRLERNDILIHLCKDEEFCKFIDYNKNKLRLYKIIKRLVDKKFYSLSYLLIKKRIS